MVLEGSCYFLLTLILGNHEQLQGLRVVDVHPPARASSLAGPSARVRDSSPTSARQ